MLELVRKVGPEGIGLKELRAIAIKEPRGGKGIRASKVDDSAERLMRAGKFVKVGGRWRTT